MVRVQSGELEGAREALREAIDLGGGDGDTWGLLGFACHGTGRYAEAESAYWMAQLLDPATEDWSLGLLRTFSALGRYAEVVSMTERMLEDAPGNAELLLLQANAWLGLGRPAKAAETYERLDRAGAASAEVLNRLGDLRLNAGEPRLALEAWLRALELDPADAAGHAGQAARALVARGEVELTRALLERAAALASGEREVALDALELRARLAEAAGDPAVERGLLEQLIALDPADGGLLLQLGANLQRTGEFARARALFERAATLVEHEPDALLHHGQLLVAQGRNERALALLRGSHALQPRESLAQYIARIEEVVRSTVHEAEDLDEPPRALLQPSPVLTAALRARGPATVHVVLVIGVEGAVEEATVQSSSDAAFEEATLKAVRRWRYAPGRRDGEPVRTRLRVPLRFPRGDL